MPASLRFAPLPRPLNSSVRQLSRIVCYGKGEIVRAKKKNQVIYLIVLILATVGYLTSDKLLDYYLSYDPLQVKQNPELLVKELNEKYKVITLVGAIVLSLVAFPFARTGVRTLRSSQFPPPGTTLLFDIERRSSWYAKVMGILLLIFASAILAQAAIGFWFWP